MNIADAFETKLKTKTERQGYRLTCKTQREASWLEDSFTKSLANRPKENGQKMPSLLRRGTLLLYFNSNKEI